MSGFFQSPNEVNANDEVQLDEDDPITRSNLEMVKLSSPSIESSITSSKFSSTTSLLGNENNAQSLISNFVDKVTDFEKKELDSMLSKAIYSSGSPLSLLQNIYWKKLFDKLRPAYVLPTPYQ